MSSIHNMLTIRRSCCPTTLLNDQIRALLDGLLSKSNEALACFKKALQARCPHVLAKCDDMPHDFTQFDADLRSYYESIEELRPLSWIKDKSACVKMSDTCRLGMIDKEDAKVMASGPNGKQRL